MFDVQIPISKVKYPFVVTEFVEDIVKPRREVVLKRKKKKK